MKTIMWKGIEIPDKDCFKKGKKCTPECSNYDLGNLYLPYENVDGGINIMNEEIINFMIDERNKNIVTINDSEIIINGQKDKQIKIIGTNDVTNPNDACALFMKIIDKNGNEVQTNSIIKISKIVNGEVESIPARIFYADVNMHRAYYNEKKELITRPKTNLEWFRFKKSIILNESDQLIVRAIHFNKNKISKTETMFALEAFVTEINNG